MTSAYLATNKRQTISISCSRSRAEASSDNNYILCHVEYFLSKIEFGYAGQPKVDSMGYRSQNLVDSNSSSDLSCSIKGWENISYPRKNWV